MSKDAPEFGSQDNEDAVLAALFPSDDIQEELGKRFYVDVGAHHPTNCSNTWQFYCRGWRGLLIEPLMDCWPDLLKQRPGDILIPFAASNVNHEVKLRVQGSISTIEATWPVNSLRLDKIDALTLQYILSKVPIDSRSFELCSIDVEWHEKQVLEGIDWNTFRPSVFCVEYLGYTEDNTGCDLSPQWEDILFDNKYKYITKTSFNKIYLASELVKSFRGRIFQAQSAAKA